MNHLYARISTDDRDQKIETQIQFIQMQHDIDVIWTDEGVRGKSDPLSRDGFSSMYKSLQPGDVVYVVEISRISRQTIKTLSLYAELGSMGVTVVSLSEGKFDLSNPDDYFRLTILAGINQRESQVLGRRVKMGMVAAKQRGVHCGRSSDGDMSLAQQMLSEGFTVADIVTKSGVSRATVYRLRKENAQNAI
ncbi:recombinase family protein [Escherichia coli]|uniref:recombinase family protein n=1 Tax=Escherichia coli TaxID=562 RepID=UPI0037DD201B